jgi:hypothetical protein
MEWKSWSQEDVTRSMVRLDMGSNGCPELERRLVWCHGEVVDGVGDTSVQPAANTVVCLFPSVDTRIRWGSSVDVAKETELAAHGLEGAPLGVVGGSKLQLHGDVRLDSDGDIGLHHGDVDQISSRTGGGSVAGGQGHQQIGSVGGRGVACGCQGGGAHGGVVGGM